MKGVLDWVKGHLVIVVCSALIVIALPIAYVMSSGWNTKLLAKQQKKFKQDWDNINSFDITYQVPRVSAGGEEISKKFAPNQAMIDAYVQIIKAQREEATQVALEGLEFNRKGREPFVSGLFPQPRTEVDAQIKPFDFIDVLRGKGTVPSVYDQLLASYNAGGPLDSVAVQGAVERRQEEFKAELQRKRGPADTMSAEEQAQLRSALSDRRIDLYRRRAQNLSLYCLPETLKGDDAGQVPERRPSEAQSPEYLFQLQWRYWIIEDLLRAIDDANTDNGRRQTVDNAVVKRLKSLEIVGFSLTRGEGEGRPADLPAVPETNGVVGTTDVYSVTGRLTNPGNQVYDARFVNVSLIVDSARLPQFLAALHRTNFMTVTDMDISRVDVWADLKEGYYYGPQNVVEVKLEIESLWLRDWMRDLMPARLKQYLGVQEAPGGSN